MIYSYERTAAAPMSESDFWDIVDKIGWTKGGNYKAGKKRLMELLPTPEEGKSFDETFRKMQGQLARAIRKYEKENDTFIETGDDGFGDLTSHIIGLGKKEYEANLRDPSLAFTRAKKYDYTESFAYVIPHAEDYKKKGNVGAFKDWAERNRENYNNLLKHEMFKPLQSEAKVVVRAMDLLIKGDTQAFLDTQSMVEKSMAAIETWFEDLHSVLGTFDSSPWGVKNLYSDVKESLT